VSKNRKKGDEDPLEGMDEVDRALAELKLKPVQISPKRSILTFGQIRGSTGSRSFGSIKGICHSGRIKAVRGFPVSMVIAE